MVPASPMALGSMDGERSSATTCGTGSGRWCCSTPAPGRATAAKSSLSTRIPATFRPRSAWRTDRNLGPDGRFLSADRLRADLTPLFGDRDVVTSCGSGTSATHHILAARVAGLRDPILYVGSYSDWSRSGYPVVVGTEPGRPEDAVGP